jgi:hypothetical protein
MVYPAARIDYIWRSPVLDRGLEQGDGFLEAYQAGKREYTCP